MDLSEFMRCEVAVEVGLQANSCKHNRPDVHHHSVIPPSARKWRAPAVCAGAVEIGECLRNLGAKAVTATRR